MSDNKEDKGLISKFVPWIILYTFLILTLLIAKFSTFEFSDDISKWGSVGDYFGGLINPMLAFLSFIALLAALKYQRDQIEQTTTQLRQNEQALEQAILAIQQNEKALSQNANALEINNAELALATKAHQEIEKTQKLQQFENNFYQLFSQLNNLQDYLLEEYVGKIDSILNSELNVFGTKKQLINSRKISGYFILLYQIMKLIDNEVKNFPSEYKKDTEEWKIEIKKQKKFYTNLIRSQQEDKILQLLFINCFDDGFSEYKRYLREASFFEHMSLTNDVGYNYQLLCALPFYILDDKELKKSKNIPFFDEGLGLLGLTQPEIAPLLKIIYQKKEKSFTEMQFLQQITCDFLHVGEHTLHDKNVLLKRLSFLRESSLNLEFQIINQNILKEIDIKINRVIFNIEQIHIVGDREEFIVLDLDKKHVLLKRIESGDESHLDGIYP
ncbi:putative phage abortive infection protein [Acinetobacter sp. B51(2017)]|uniref:putative phage abortive infection protein n=1 Tax=Acinetobacter sp. B51(2017) TaxID=2060938 RepID=UPI000F07F95A|nr:putative phage abortive infection protein [Acinetobacter sp. B51(2017)]